MTRWNHQTTCKLRRVTSGGSGFFLVVTSPANLGLHVYHPISENLAVPSQKSANHALDIPHKPTMNSRLMKKRAIAAV